MVGSWSTSSGSVTFHRNDFSTLGRCTKTFGRFGRVFRFNFLSRARSSSETVESNRNSVCWTSLLISWKLLKPLWVGKSSENERERRLPKGAMRWAGSAFCQKSDRGPTVTWTRRRWVSGSSWKRTAPLDRPASYKNKTKEALCSRLQPLKWVLNFIVIFVPAGPQNVSPVLNDLARLRATAKFQITPACNFRESILIPFFFLVFLHVEGDFVFSFLLLSGISNRTAHRFDRPWSWRDKINKQRRCARKSAWTCSGGLFCRCSIVKKSVCTWYKKTFLGGFFSCWQYI